MSAPKSTRPPLKQQTPVSLVKSILQTVREVYCPNADNKEWFKKHRSPIMAWCILEPAKFIVKKGFTLPGDRFKQILVGIITDSKRNCTGTITYLPAYLRKCVQSHFEIHWEEYQRESKRADLAAEAALFALKALPVADRSVETIAALAKSTAEQLKPGPKKPKLAKPDDQPTLF